MDKEFKFEVSREKSLIIDVVNGQALFHWEIQAFNELIMIQSIMNQSFLLQGTFDKAKKNLKDDFK